MKSLKRSPPSRGKTVLISLHPEHALKILSGEKKLEFRRRWASDPVEQIVIYATAPVKKLVGVASVKRAHRGSPTALWELAKRLGGGLTRQALRDYFSSQPEGIAIEIGHLSQFSPALDPTVIFEKFSAPQSFCYLADTSLEKIDAVLERQKSLGNLIFVAGVHGAGKTTLCENLGFPGISHRSASSLIKEERAEAISSTRKTVKDMRGNQELLVRAVNKIRATGKPILLDGHFALLDESYKAQPIPAEVFSELGVRAIVLVHDKATEISKRLKERDNGALTAKVIARLQSVEFSQAELVARELCVPVYRFHSSTEIKEFVSTVTALCQYKQWHCQN
jgi:predicted transcriptional regulator/adenylate kinase